MRQITPSARKNIRRALLSASRWRQVCAGGMTDMNETASLSRPPASRIEPGLEHVVIMPGLGIVVPHQDAANVALAFSA
jgi:hypothetical protein